MTEFLKNNPIAVRHCLLYLFLQQKSIKEAFDDFCEIVGPNIINKEEFQFWFDQFENGNFDGVEQPMTDMRDILRSDKNALRVCIFYESLKFKHLEFKKNDKFIHHPVFSVYMHFCKVIGDGAMEFSDFDFWFYRFANGMFDLKFEKDEKHKIYELTDMPIDIMRNIVEYLNIVDRLFSQDQKVCHSFLKLNVYNNNSARIGFGREDQIDYEDKGNHCVMTYGGRVKVLRGVSFLKKALQDFKKILENPKLYLQTLIILCWREDPDSSGRYIEDALKFTHLLHVQQLSLDIQSMKTLLNILRSLKPGYLTTITIGTDLDEAAIEEIVEMNQWKQAKYLNMGFKQFIGPLRHLYHFHEFTVCYWMLQEDDVREIKEILLKSSDFEKCDLYFRDFVDPFSIMQVFGGPIEGSIDTCHYPIPNSTEYFEIFVSYRIMKIERKKK